MHTILVVDDDPSVGELWERTLADAGYRVLRTADAVEAARLMVDIKPAVAICDVHLPDGGLWLVELIRQQLPMTAIVLATADGSFPPSERFRPGIVAQLLKPVMRRELLVAVEAGIAWVVRERGRL